MKCRFDETKECIKAELFTQWKDDKKETAYLTLGVCPQCPVYRGDEVEKEVTKWL